MNRSETPTFRTRLSTLREINRRRAREAARRIRGDTLATLVDQYIEWWAFVLWARAIVEAEETIPPQVADALQLRCPGFVFAASTATAPEFWLALSRWIDHNVFRQPCQEDWLIAVQYYASRDLRWEQLWLCWEHCDDRWQKSPPASYPSFEEWRREATQWRFPPPQRRGAACDCAHLVSPEQLSKAVAAYLECEAFAYWVRAVMSAHRGMPAMVAECIDDRCPGLLEHLRGEGAPLSDAAVVWRRLIAWMDDRVFGAAKKEGWFQAITFFARRSLQAERTVAYWAACDRTWSRHRPVAHPDFDAWRRAVQSYVER